MFNLDRNVVIFSVVLAFVIIGSILEGYILHDHIQMTMDSWRMVFLGRFVLHIIGILPFWILLGFLMESIWKTVLLGILNLAIMNVNPIYDLVEGPIVINNPQPEEWYREEYNNPSSDFDYSTHKVSMIRLQQGKRSILLTEEQWKDLIEICNGQKPVYFVGLENMEVPLKCTCP